MRHCDDDGRSNERTATHRRVVLVADVDLPREHSLPRLLPSDDTAFLLRPALGVSSHGQLCRLLHSDTTLSCWALATGLWVGQGKVDILGASND